MKQVAAILFAGLFTYSASLSSGLILLKLLRLRLYRAEMLFLGFVLGAACLSTLVFGLTVAHLAYTGVFLAVGLLLIAGAIRFDAWQYEGDSPPLDWKWKVPFFALYATFGILYIGYALLPEASPDGITYHVALIARYFREHHLPPIATNFLANYPEGAEMLFLFGFSIGRHSAAAIVHLLFLLTLPFGMLACARRFGNPSAGVAGGLLFFLSPVAGRDGTVAYNDVALACVLFACFSVLQIWREHRRASLLFAAGLLAGFAYAVKYTGGLAIIYALALVVFHCRRKFLRPAILVTAGAFLMMAPWLLKNIIVVHNPFMPFANRIFANPYLYASTEQEITYYVIHPPGIQPRDLPLEATIHGREDGLVGPIFLLAPLMLLALGHRTGRQLLLAAVIFVLPYLGNVSTRFLLPCLPFVALAMMWTISRWKILAIPLLLVHAIASWPAVLDRYSGPGCWCLQSPDWHDSFRRRPPEDYLRENASDYSIGLLLNQRVPAGDRILTTSTLQSAYHARDVIDPWNNSYGVRLVAALNAAFDPAWQPLWRHDFHFDERSVRGIRLVETARAVSGNWNIFEVRIYRAGVELPRAAQWRLKAWPNPWEVQSAFDNNPVTRWTSGQALTPGMYLQVDFGQEQTIDEVVVECAHVPEEMRMRLESTGGQLLAASADLRDAPVLPRLRRAAIETLKSSGINWLLVNDRDGGAADFRDRAAQWGIESVATDGPYRLYRLQ
jgi:dolichyl-phosphate-mannose-protein mannosyltransferase